MNELATQSQRYSPAPDRSRDYSAEVGRPGATSADAQETWQDLARASWTPENLVLATATGARGFDRNHDRVQDGGVLNFAAGEAPRIRELKLNNSTGNHKVDAAVLVPQGYDPSLPTRLLIYNHGYRTSAHAALNYSQLTEQMKSADPQTVLVVPEWQSRPGSNSPARGRSDEQGFYRNMLNEIMSKTPELRGKSVDNIASIGIISHSAGFSPTRAQLYNNGLGDKVTSVTVLDSMYNARAYDKWITDNLRDLASGRKQFQVIYTDHLSGQTNGLETRVQQQLRRAGLNTNSVYSENSRGSSVVSADTLASHGIVFKRSNYTERGEGAHGAMTRVYLRQLLEAERRRN
jgi:hypothetical protein